MRCIERGCEHRELNGGDEISDFYFCKACGISVDRGEDECLIDEEWNDTEDILEDEEDNLPCRTCEANDTCDENKAAFCCDLCCYYNDEPDCEGCDHTKSVIE